MRAGESTIMLKCMVGMLEAFGSPLVPLTDKWKRNKGEGMGQTI